MTQNDSDWLQTSKEIEDARWSRRAQLRDWAILGVMVATMVGWSLLVFLTEPGIR